MKIAGKELSSEPNVEVLVIPRSSGDIPFECKAVLDFTEFDQLCPAPTPPTVTTPGDGIQVPDLEDEEYKKTVVVHGKKRIDWMILKSLSSPQGLEWDTVDMKDPETWANYETELQNAGFAFMEVVHIRNKCLEVNMFDETKMEQARKRFLAIKAEQQKD